MEKTSCFHLKNLLDSIQWAFAQPLSLWCACKPARKPACRCVFGVEVYPAEGGVREKVRSGEAGAAEGWSCGKERSGYGLQLMRGTCSLRARGDERHASGVLRFTEQEGLH